MPKLSDVIEVIETLAPPRLADDWDNSGLQVGDAGAEVKSVLVALDPVPDVMAEAASLGAGLVVAHHPLFFGTVKSLELGRGTGAVVNAAIKNGIAIYSAHTSFDRAKTGVSDALADALMLKGTKPLTAVAGFPGCGYGRVGKLPAKQSIGDIAKRLKTALGAGTVRLTGDPKKKVGTVAVCGGSGSSLMEDALSAGAELYVTGDIKYHDALKALELGLSVLDVGHFASELAAVPLMAGLLTKAFTKKGWKIKVDISKAQGEPWSYL